MEKIQISVGFIEELFETPNSLLYFRSYLLLLGLTAYHGGNLPSLEVCSTALGKSKRTTNIHLKTLLRFGWIRENVEKDGKYTIVGSKLLPRKYKAKFYSTLDVNSFSTTTQQHFNALLAEILFDKVQRGKIKRKQFESKKEKEEREFKGVINRFYVDVENRIYLTKSKLTKTNKLKFTHIKYVNVDGILEAKIRVRYFDFKTGSADCLYFVFDEQLKKDIVENFKLKVLELSEVNAVEDSIPHTCREEEKLKHQMSYTYRSKIAKRTPITIKNYQKHFSSRYTREKETTEVTYSYNPYFDCEVLNELNFLGGKYIVVGNRIKYSPTTIRVVEKIEMKKRNKKRKVATLSPS